MPNNATLTLRCPTKGHKLVEVFWHRGKPMAHCRESGIYVTRDPYRIGAPKTFVTEWDLYEHANDPTHVHVACRCGTRNVSLREVLDLVEAGSTGKHLTNAPAL